MPLTKADLVDVDIVDAYELKSDGSSGTAASIYQTTSGISTTASTKTIISNPPADGEGFLTGRDHPVEIGDLLFITGTAPGGAADGRYTIATIVNDTTVTVVETIADSTGGTYTWVYPAGARKVGFDPTGQTVTTAKTVQQALLDIANNVGGGGITEAQHEALDTLVHEIDETSYDHAVYTGNDLTGLITWTSLAMTLKIREEQYTYNPNHTVSQVVVIQYDALGVEKMRYTEVYTYTVGSRIQSITRTKVP